LTRGLAHRAKLDGNADLAEFSRMLEEATLGAVEEGVMTKDLAIIATGRWDVVEGEDFAPTEVYMDRVDQLFRAKWEAYNAKK